MSKKHILDHGIWDYELVKLVQELLGNEPDDVMVEVKGKYLIIEVHENE